MNKIIKIIKLMIELNESVRNQLSDIAKKHIKRSHFNREWGTIHINPGRRTGKTAAMCTLARTNDLIIVHNHATKNTLIRNNPDCLAMIYTISEIINPINKGFGHKFDYVWIDEYNLCENLYDTNQLYELIDANLFIKLGE